jgi:ferritin
MINDDELVSIVNGIYEPDTQSKKYYPDCSQWFRKRRQNSVPGTAYYMRTLSRANRCFIVKQFGFIA